MSKRKVLALLILIIAFVSLIPLFNFYRARKSPVINEPLVNKKLTKKENIPVINQTGTIFVVGGSIKDPKTKSTSSTNSAEFYNLKTKKWQSMPSMNKDHEAGAVAASGNKIYVFGGSGGRIWGGTNVTEEFDVTTNLWTVKKEMPHTRFFAQAIALGGKIYLLGGENNASLNKFVDIYDPDSDTWASGPDIPVDVDYYSLPICQGAGNKIYCPGLAEHAYTLVYDTEQNIWTSLATEGRAILYQPSWASNGNVLRGISLYSGADGKIKNDIIIYDPSLDKLTIKSAGNYIHNSYQNFQPLLLGNNFFLIGGEFTGGPVRDVYVFDMENSSVWEKTTPMNSARSRAGVAFLPIDYNGVKMEGGSIGGVIIKNGKPFVGRLVRLDTDFFTDNGYKSNTRTDSNGHYSFVALKPAIYHLYIHEDKDDDPSSHYIDITFNGKKQTSGIKLEKNQIINDLVKNMDWPGNYWDFPDKYKDSLDKYNGVPLK